MDKMTDSLELAQVSDELSLDQRSDRFRQRLTMAIVAFTFAITAIAIFLTAVFASRSTKDTTYTQLAAFVAPMLALSGAVLGFYFGGRRDGVAAEDGTSRRPCVKLEDALNLLSKGIAELDSDSQIRRVAGVRLLALAGQSLQLRAVVTDVLASLVRTSSQREPGDLDDIRAALDAIGRQPYDSKGIDLSGAQLRDLRLTNLRLDGADLSFADLDGSVLDGSRFIGANLRGTSLRSCRALGANFSGAVLQNADLTAGLFVGANFSGALVTGSVFDRAVLTNTKFTGALIADASMSEADTREAISLHQLTVPDQIISLSPNLSDDGLD